VSEKPVILEQSRSNIKVTRSSRVIMVLAILLAALFLYLAVRHVSGTEMLQTLRQIRPEYIILAFLFNTLALFMRGFRWGVLISAQKKVNPVTMFLVDAVGYMGNTFLPARAGELLRSYLLGENAGISSSYVFATALTERIMDVVALVITGSIVIFTISASVPGWLPATIRWMALAGVIGMIIFLLAPRFENFIQKILSGLRLPGNWTPRISGLITQFLLGARAFVNPARALAFVGLTAVIWLIDGTGTVIFAHGMGLSISLGQALLLLVALGLSSALPSTPGYVGIYQFVAVTLMPTFGLTPSQALVYILACQAINVITISLWGLVGLWRFGIKPAEVLASSE
jgi:glycosyltransferase 2 family protein